MLDVSADNLREEITAAIQLRQKHVTVMNEMIGRYAGAYYRDDWEPEGPAIENHEFEFLVNIVPALLANNPAVSVRSRRPVVQRELVEAMQHGLNRWIHDVNLVQRMEDTLYDAVFKFGVVAITLEPLPGHEHKDHPPVRPAIRRISPRMFFTDPQATSPHDARFKGHIFLRDKDDLLEAKNPDGTPKFNKKAIESLASEDGAGDAISDSFLEDSHTKVYRNQVVGAEVFVRETGMIYTLGFSSVKDGSGKQQTKGAFIRKPRPYFGHPRGPYIEFGFYIVPDQVYPLSPLCVTAEAVEEINLHSDQARRQASNFRNLLLVDGQNTPLLDAVKNFEDGTIAAIPQFDRNAFAEISLGGNDPQQLQYIENLRARIDRRSGITDIQRGNISGDATATEAQLAAAAASGRVRYMQQRMNRSMTAVLENVAYLMFHSSSVVFPVSKQRAEKISFQMNAGVLSAQVEDNEDEDLVFYGGVQQGQEDFTFFDLELEIDPYSMERVDEAVLQKRMEVATVTVTKFAPLILQFPFINWPELLDDYFQSLNIPDGRKYVDWELVSQLLQIKFQGGDPRGIPGIDGAPPVDTETFKGPPNMPAGSRAREAVGQGPEVASQGAARELAAILGGANSAA